MYENRSDLYCLTDTKITKPTHNFSFNSFTLFMSPEAEPYVFRVRNLRFRFGKTYGFHAENIKQTKPKRHYLQQVFQSYQTKKSPEVQKHTSGDFSQDKLYSLNFFLQIQREFRHSPILGTYKCRSLYSQFMRFAYGLSFQDRSHESSSE